jgi:hypothetical protein
MGRARKDEERIAKPLPLALNMKSRNDMTKKSRVAIFYYFRSFNLRAFI